MVDAIVSYAVTKLGDFLIQEAVFLKGVKKDVIWLQNELKWMRSFLQDAEQKQDSDERIRTWVSEVRDIAYRSEDVIDTFIFKAKGIEYSTKKSFSSSVLNCFCIKKQSHLYEVGDEIEMLKNRLTGVARKVQGYGLKSIGETQNTTTTTGVTLRDLRVTTSYDDDEEHIVGFEDDAEFLEAKLAVEDQPRRSVISILGMGGLGKTTLARKLYNNNCSKFDGHAWICVSQEWKTRDLLERLIKSFKKLTRDEFEMLEMMKDYDMENYLRDLLLNCHYLVVIDDVWQKTAWESLRRAFPDNGFGSRIIITTRIRDVAELSDKRTYVHRLRFLRPDESWKLFCKKAFLTDSIPEDMVKLGEEMVTKCDGLPLAIIVLGGLLSRKQFHEWGVVKERIWRELKNNSIHVSSLLALSYKDLPNELKSCFLYLGLFPEDFVIDVNKLIQLWIAEEFISQGKEEGLEMEEVAEDYLKELIGRSLVQAGKRNWKMFSTCRVHDLLRDLAVTKAKELNFLHICDETTSYSTSSSMASSFKRVAFRSGFESYMSFDHSLQQVRTLSFLNNEVLDQYSFNHSAVEKLMTLLPTRFKLVRVLDLEGVGIASVPAKQKLFDALAKLIHLRYLGLKSTLLNQLPESIANLQALQTLDASTNEGRILLPKGLSKIKQLRHLIGEFKTEEGSVCVTPALFHDMTNLQSINDIDIDGWLKQQEGKELALNAFTKLVNLKSLSVRFYTHYMLSVEPLFCCKHLTELKIDGRIGKLPKEMHGKLPKLKYVNLVYSGFEEDPMPVLELLPNLIFLELEAVEVKTMICSAKGFPQLGILKLIRISDVTDLQVDEGAMPRLKALSLEDLKKRQSLPERLSSLPDASSLSNWEWEDGAY